LEEALRHYYQFLSKPDLKWLKVASVPLRHLAGLFFIVLFVELIVAGLLFNLIGLEESDHKLTDLFDELDFFRIFVLAVIIAPVFEELLFRYYLTLPLLVVIGLPIAGLGGALYFIISGGMEILVGIPCVILLVALIIHVLNSEASRSQLQSLYIRYFPFVFYMSAVIFAFVHIYNFNDDMVWYHAPALVFPQFFIGLYLAYVRIRNGILTSMAVHAVNNAIPMVILLLTPGTG